MLSKSKTFGTLWESMDWIDDQCKRHPNFSKTEIAYNYDLDYVACIFYEQEENPNGDLFESA